MATASPIATLLVIEDDVHLADAVSRYLSRGGYRVKVAYDGMAAMRMFEEETPDLVVLDLMLPLMDGWEVCRRLRAVSPVPIIMLTARASESDRVLGLRIGADDYVVKPFSLRELQARIEAVLRRAGITRELLAQVVYDDGLLRLERDGWQVVREGKVLSLTATERRLLFALAESAGRVLSVESLLRMVWGPSYVNQENYVKLYVWRLRQKIEPDPGRPAYIRTERGIGYRFRSRPPEDPVPADPEST
jgi:DNA-binding response OmpR family regulator